MSDAPFILAMDVSKTHTGICEGRVGETPRFHSVTGNDVNDVAAMMRLFRWMADRFRLDAPDWLYFEAPISAGAFMGEYDEDRGRVRMTSNPKTTIALAKMIAVVELVGGMKSVQTREAKVQTVRKAFIGHSNLKGDIAKRRVRAMCTHLGWSPNNNDESDAAAVWWWAGTQVAPRVSTVITPMLQAKVATQIDQATPVKRGWV